MSGPLFAPYIMINIHNRHSKRFMMQNVAEVYIHLEQIYIEAADSRSL